MPLPEQRLFGAILQATFGCTLQLPRVPLVPLVTIYIGQGACGQLATCLAGNYAYYSCLLYVVEGFTFNSCGVRYIYIESHLTY